MAVAIIGPQSWADSVFEVKICIPSPGKTPIVHDLRRGSRYLDYLRSVLCLIPSKGLVEDGTGGLLICHQDIDEVPSHRRPDCFCA